MVEMRGRRRIQHARYISVCIYAESIFSWNSPCGDYSADWGHCSVKKTFYDSFITTKNKNTITVNVWNRKVEIKQQKTSSHECLEILCNLAKNGFITIEEDRQENR